MAGFSPLVTFIRGAAAATPAAYRSTAAFSRSVGRYSAFGACGSRFLRLLNGQPPCGDSHFSTEAAANATIISASFPTLQGVVFDFLRLPSPSPGVRLRVLVLFAAPV